MRDLAKVALRTIPAGVLVVAAIAKSPSVLAREIALASPLSAGLAHVAAWLVVLAEFATAAALLAPSTRRAAWMGVGMLGTCYLTYHVAAVAFGDPRPCLCLGFQITRRAALDHAILGVLSATLIAGSFVGVLRDHGGYRRLKDGIND